MVLLSLQKSYRLSLTFKALLSFEFVFWVLFPTEKVYFLFKQFLKDKKLLVKCVKLQSFLKSDITSKYTFLLKGGAFLIASTSQEDFLQIFSFFVKDVFFKKLHQSKEKILKNLSEYLNFMNGFVITAKIYNFIFNCDTAFFLFFKEFFIENPNIFLYYNFLFLKMTTVVLISIMLITIRICILFWKIFFRLVSTTAFVFMSYANTKSIST